MTLGFIGTGVISEAIVTGLLKAKYPAETIYLSARSREISARLAMLSEKVRVCETNDEIVAKADVVFLAVRPQHAKDVLEPLSFRSGQVVVSLIATVSIDDLNGWTHPEANVCRAIPLPSVSELNGVTAVFPPLRVATDIFDYLGQAVAANSLREFDAYAVASAMMGFYFGVAETAAQWLSQQGARYEASQVYLAKMFQALTETAIQRPDQSFEDLRLGHTTPGGLNAQLHETFSGQGGTDALVLAFEAVAERIRNNH
ncbi:pyrroline-5-carboxylate reductase [uncultured Roseobacter sp.]|uniref:pyrroline-5-carboxylate reductase n=1 Tax=uncultured Roseobacter sp. TaxID=114847 RepID=UPI002635B695|nr:pyrroline-5-carboxylate reductase [uncultured Roseobacter sp.]